jgi:hypothetical protein
MGDWGVGSPSCLLLDHWALLVQPIFDETPYLVGSAAASSTWRDVDVRVIMDDEKFDAWFGDSRATCNVNGAKWSGLMTAISLWGQKVTGLPIDFQVQRRSRVSETDWKKPRHPLGIFAMEGDLVVVRSPRVAPREAELDGARSAEFHNTTTPESATSRHTTEVR